MPLVLAQQTGVWIYVGGLISSDPVIEQTHCSERVESFAIRNKGYRYEVPVAAGDIAGN